MPQTKKKVLFTSHTANFSKFNRPFMRWFKEQGYEVHYASMGEEKVLDCDKHFTVPFTRSPFKLSNITAYHQLKKIIDAENYDIIHTHTPMGSVVTRLAAIAARKKGTRVIYTAHGFHFFKGAPLLNWLIYYPVEKYMARHTDTLITINKEDYERAKKKFSTKIQYVPGVGIDPKKFDVKMSKEAKLKLRKSLGLKEDDFVIIYIAELNKNKNQTMAINAMDQLVKSHPNAHLLLVGQDSLGGYHKRLAARKNITSNVHFLGYRNDIPELLKISDLGISTSQREGLAVNVMEAMYSGLPTITTTSRGNGDVIRNKKTGFLTAPDDVAELTKKLTYLIKHPETGQKMGEVGKLLAQRTYSTNEILPQMTQVYTQKKVIFHLLASNRFSGAENVACQLIEETDSKKYNSYYISPSGDIVNALAARHIHHVPIQNLSFNELRKVCQEYRPDVIHAHDFKASIFASFFAKKSKIISHIHQNPTWLNSLSLHSLVYIVASLNFDKIFIVTNEINNTVVFKHIAQNKIELLHNSLDLSKVKDLASQGHNKTYDLMFCGRLESVKKPLDFIRLIALIKEQKGSVTAVMVGEGSLMPECLSLINNLRLDIRLVGFQDNPYKYMSRSRFLAITSQAEGFGLVATEAMALGLVVLSYDLPSLREVIGYKSDVFGKNPKELADIFERYNSNPLIYKKRANLNRKSVERFTHSNRNITAKYGDLLLRAIP